MTRFTTLAALTSLGFIAALPAAAQAGKSPLGVWMNDTGRGAIEITECGSKLCGHLVWAKSKKDTDRGCGKQIIGNAKKVSSKTWDNGWIYSPEKKRKYSVELKPLSGDRLRVKGYRGSKFFSKTMIWTKAAEDLQRCDGVDNGTVLAANTEPAAEKYENTTVTETAPTNETRKPVKQYEEPVEENEEEVAEADEGGSPLEGLDLDKYFKKTDNGDCKLNTPWIKLRFKCDD
ncbi:MAG: DUF2147 domain-containing protein [Pseudomonadota bacterium]